MGRYSEAEHWLGFKHRDIMVDIYRRKKGATCCELEHDLEETTCLVCGGPLEPEEVFQICIAGVYIPGAESPEGHDAVELAMYIIDECPEALRDPEEYVLARLDIETDDDDDEDAEPPPEPPDGPFDLTLGKGDAGKNGKGASDLLDPVGPGDILTEAELADQLVEETLSETKLSIVPAGRSGRGNLTSLKDAARTASLAKQIKQLKWGQKAKRIVDAARKKK